MTSSHPYSKLVLDTNLLRSPLERAAFALLGALSLALLFSIVPFYNWWYRILMGFAGAILLLLSPLAVGLLLALSLHRRRAKRLLLIATWGLGLFLAWRYILPLRHSLTDLIIQRIYCQHPLDQGEIILGGIRHSEHIFINDSHCLIVVCAEEFYYCL